MRYEGTIEAVQNIESQIRHNAICVEQKIPTKDYLFGVESIVDSKIVEVLTARTRFFVRLHYDKREDTPVNKRAYLDVRNDKFFFLCRVAPNLVKMIAELEPCKKERQ